MDADEVQVLPPYSKQGYDLYGSSRFTQGARTRFGQPGDHAFRPVGTALSNRTTADVRSVFEDWTLLTDGRFAYNYEKLDLQWAVRVTYERSPTDTDANIADQNDSLLLYTNLDLTLRMLEVSPQTSQGPQQMIDLILCDSIEEALAVIQRVTYRDLASELKPHVYTPDTLETTVSLEQQYYQIVDVRTRNYPTPEQ